MGDESADNAAWSYEQPQEPVIDIKNFIAFYRDKVGAWHEEA